MSGDTCDLLCLDVPKAEALRRRRLAVEAAEQAAARAKALADPTRLTPDAPPARTAIEVIRSGDAAALERLLREHPALVHVRIADPECREARTLLHVVTDWPGHVPEAAAKIRALVDAGADVDARFTGSHGETPLHWAASSDDIEALDALLDAGAAIETAAR